MPEHGFSAHHEETFGPCWLDRIRGLRFEERIYPGARHEVFNETNSAEVLADVIGFVHRVLG